MLPASLGRSSVRVSGRSLPTQAAEAQATGTAGTPHIRRPSLPPHPPRLRRRPLQPPSRLWKRRRRHRVRRPRRLLRPRRSRRNPTPSAALARSAAFRGRRVAREPFHELSVIRSASSGRRHALPGARHKGAVWNRLRDGHRRLELGGPSCAAARRWWKDGSGEPRRGLRRLSPRASLAAAPEEH